MPDTNATSISVGSSSEHELFKGKDPSYDAKRISPIRFTAGDINTDFTMDGMKFIGPRSFCSCKFAF